VVKVLVEEDPMATLVTKVDVEVVVRITATNKMKATNRTNTERDQNAAQKGYDEMFLLHVKFCH
jgi:hypothetical protein